MRRAIVLAALASGGCSLILSGSDLSGGRADAAPVDAPPALDAGDAASPDASPDANDDGGGCAAPDVDGDGYPRPECAAVSEPSDCDDSDPTLSPWPPRIMPMWRAHAPGYSSASALEATAISPSCGIVALLAAVGPFVGVGIDSLADSSDSCVTATVLNPGTTDCGAAAQYDDFEAIDLRAEGVDPQLSLIGMCHGSGLRARTMTLSGAVVNQAVVSGTGAGALETLSGPPASFAIGLSTSVQVESASGGQMLQALASPWISATGDLVLFQSGPSTIGAAFLDAMMPATYVPVSYPTPITGRSVLLHNADGYVYVAPLSQVTASQLVLVGPFTTPTELEGELPAPGRGSVATTAPMLDAALAGQRHIIALTAEGDGTVALRLATSMDGAGFDGQVANLGTPVPGGTIVDVAIAVAGDGSRVSVFVAAAGPTTMFSTRVGLCPLGL